MGRPSKKQQILNSARGLFTERGYQGTTVDLVVQTAGVSKPTVYGHFPSKQELWQAMLAQAIETAERQRDAIEVAEGDAIDTVIGAYRLLSAQPDMLAVYRILLGERHKMAAEARQRFDEFESRLEAWCGRVLRAQGLALDEGQRFVLRALCREAILQPALREQPGPDSAWLKATIAQVLRVS